jgi:para-nitrobenzyl esterase
MNCFFKPLLTIFPLLLSLHALAQINPGCDGERYREDVFPTFTKTTVNYASAVNVLGATVNLGMDVYEPAGDGIARRPAVVLAHGGSFIAGDKADMSTWAVLLAKKGYVAVSINYQLFPFFALGFPDSFDVMGTAVRAVGDMKAAVRYLRLDAATANQFKIDPDHIFIGGYSAGAVIALHAAYLDSNDVIPNFLADSLTANGGLEGLTGSAANQSYSSSSELVINMSGGLYRSYWIDAGEMPLSSIHGTADQTVKFVSGLAANIAYLEGSSLLHARAALEGVWNELEIVVGGDHTNMYQNVAYADEVAHFWEVTTDKMEELTCEGSVGTGSLENPETAWLLSPNPTADGQVRLLLPAGMDQARVTVYDGQGRVVVRLENVAEGGTLSLAGLSAGTYFVQITDARDSTKRFAVRRLLVSKG